LRIGVERRSPHQTPIDGTMAMTGGVRTSSVRSTMVSGGESPLGRLGKGGAKENGRNGGRGSDGCFHVNAPCALAAAADFAA
jgi:hypothetical protein